MSQRQSRGGLASPGPGAASAARRVGGRHHAAAWPVAAARITSSEASACGSSAVEPSLPHDQDPVAHAEHLGQLGGDHQHGHAVARELESR